MMQPGSNSARLAITLVLSVLYVAFSVVATADDGHVKFLAWEQIGVGGNGYLTTIAIAPLWKREERVTSLRPVAQMHGCPGGTCGNSPGIHSWVSGAPIEY